MMPEFFEDMRKQGLNNEMTSNLMNSAEAYIKMWEKIESRTVSTEMETPTRLYTISAEIEANFVNNSAKYRANFNRAFECLRKCLVQL